VVGRTPASMGFPRAALILAGLKKIYHIGNMSTVMPPIPRLLIIFTSGLDWSEGRIQLQSNPITSLIGTKPGCNKELYIQY